MFYSHEVLTSRKYGIATVWLVATLGAKNHTRKVNRKAILGVDVPKACGTVIDPGAPMALRLQGNLLYGLSRVYLRQCEYTLSDAQVAHQAMRMALNAEKTTELDPDAGKTRPEQLILPDDPSFLPDFVLPPLELLEDLTILQITEAPLSGESQSLTPFGSQQVEDYDSPGGPVGRLIIPSSSSGGPGGFGLEGDDGPGSVGGPIDSFREATLEPPLDAPFTIDEDGNVIEVMEQNQIPSTPTIQGVDMLSDARAAARVRQDHREGQETGTKLSFNQMDIDLPIYGDDLPEGEAFPTVAEQIIGEPEQYLSKNEIIESSSSSTIAAPLRNQQRARRVIAFDNEKTLRNKDLSNWSTSYLQTMKAETKIKHNRHSKLQAKKNAEYWVWGAGIGGIGPHIYSTGPSLYGDDLFQLYTGFTRKQIAGQKRDRDSGIDEYTQESDRMRQLTNEAQIGRGVDEEAQFARNEDEALSLIGEDVEFPRDAPAPLDDQQIFSAMPWNMHSASVRGSSAVPRSGTGTQGGSRRGGRMVSASPLHGRGQPGGLDALQILGDSDAISNFGLDDYRMPGPNSDGFDPPALPNISQASARVCDALSAEGENFLGFVADAIIEKRKQKQASADDRLSDILDADGIDEVLFEDLLPPAENYKMVAVQGLMMVLTLGSNGLLCVRQEAGFDQEIGLALTEKAWAMQVAEMAQAEEQEGGYDREDEPQEEDANEDDLNSLYGD